MTEEKVVAPSGVARAVQSAGSQEKLAEMLGVTQQAVSSWLKRGWVPSGRAIEIEAQCGVARRDLINPRLANLVDAPGGDV